METKNTQVAISAQEQQVLSTFENLNNLPDLSAAEVSPVEISGEYWTPAEPGEKKRVFFVGLDSQQVIEPATGEMRELPIVKFLEKVGDSYRTIRNGSAKLVGVFQQFEASIKPGTPYEITYLGKKKTSTGKFADNWSVKPIIVK